MGPFDFTPEEATKTWGLRLMTDPLRVEILALEPEEQAERVRELRRKNSFDLECENNLARNRRLTVSMGLQQVAHFFGMKRSKPAKRGRATKRKKGEKNDEEDWDTSGDEGESDEEDAVDGEERSPVKTRGKTKAAGKSHPGGRGSSKWAETAKKMLLDGVGMGPDWEQLVERWWMLEERWKFATSVSARTVFK
jgi:hypothetical protein